MARVHSVEGRRVGPASTWWELSATAPGVAAAPGEVSNPWLPARVPGTVARALADADEWSLEEPAALHGHDFWYRAHFPASGPRTLRFHGLATLAEVWLNGEKLLSSDNMFLSHEVAVECAGENDLYLCFRALGPVLEARRGRPRWRSRMVEPGSLRFVRTTLLGHMPGWCPPVDVVGPWRPVELIEERGALRVLRADVRPRLEGPDGVLTVELQVEREGEGGSDEGGMEAFVEVGGARSPLAWADARTLRGEVRLDGVRPWWPHTHGEPALYPVRASVGGVEVDLGRTGFRTIEADAGADGRGFALRVNGDRVFCRGACWSTADIVSLPGDRDAYEPWLLRMRDAGMNMVRVAGTMVYESDAFFELCDELGILVWQDFMLANLDYPAGDHDLARSLTLEAEQLLDRLQGCPSLAVLCGGSEVEQQGAMLGLSAVARESPLFSELLPAVAARLRPDVPYLPNSPSGGELPFLASAGVTHYHGVGACLRPLEDARRAEVRFASACLAFANLPEAATLALLRGAGGTPVHHPRWKERVPRDAVASWDFEDVRDHYLGRLYGVDPQRLRHDDPDRYLRMSRAVTGEVMEEVFAEWRRGRSACGGGLVWLLQDLWPGAGWGVLDSTGAPKAAWHALRRAFRPVQVALTDEGLNGLAVHLVNETARPVTAILTLQCLRDGETPVARGEREVTLPARGAIEISSAELLPAFFDVTYAYRFAPPAHDVTVAALRAPDGARLAVAFHFPLGRGNGRFHLGLEAEAERDAEGWLLRLRTRRFAQSVHVDDDHFRPEFEWFHLPPGVERLVRLHPRDDSGATPDGEVHALNAGAGTRFRGLP